MDFHSLSRRELQSLCMSNGIKANMTNIAMADALKALQTVEGISGTPRRGEQESPALPKTGRRAASSRRAVSARPEEPKEQHGSPLPRSRRVTARLAPEVLNLAMADADEEKDQKEVTETPRAPTTRRAGGGKTDVAVGSTIRKTTTTTTTRRRATKKEEEEDKEEKTVGMTTRRRTRQSSKKEAENLDVVAAVGTNGKSTRGKSAPKKMADLEKDVDEDVSNEQPNEGKDVVEEEETGRKKEEEGKDIAQVLPIEQSKEDEICDKEEQEEEEIVEMTQVLPIEPSVEEHICDKEEQEEEEIVEITQVLPIEQSEEEIVEISQFLPIEQSEEEIVEISQVLPIVEEIVEITQVLPIEPSEEEHICNKEEQEEEDQINFLEEEIDSKKEGKEQDDGEIGEASPEEISCNDETCHQQEQLESSSEVTMQVQEPKEDSEEESPIRGVVSLCKQQQDVAEEAKVEEGRRDGTDLLLRLRKLSLSESEVDEDVSLETVSDQLSKVGAGDFSAFEAAAEFEKCCDVVDSVIDVPVEIDNSGNDDIVVSSLLTGEIPVENDNSGNDDIVVSSLLTGEIPVEMSSGEPLTKSNLIAPLASDDNKENPTVGDGRKKTVELENMKNMSLRKLRSVYKESLVNKKGEEKRSALKPLDENLLQNGVEDAVM